MTEASTSGTINTQTKYIARVVRNQRHIDFGVFNTNGTAVATESYDTTECFGEGPFGLAVAGRDSRLGGCEKGISGLRPEQWSR